MPHVTKTPLDKIRTDGGTQMRAEINQALIDEYAEAVKRGDKFPSVIVFSDGTDKWLADGFTRYYGHQKAGERVINAETIKGTLRDAILYATGANATHGQRRTNADKRKAVMKLLEDPEWVEKSDRWIAEKCNVSHPFVAAIREEMTGNVTSQTGASEIKSPVREGKDGRTYDTKNLAGKAAEAGNNSTDDEPEGDDLAGDPFTDDDLFIDENEEGEFAVGERVVSYEDPHNPKDGEIIGHPNEKTWRVAFDDGGEATVGTEYLRTLDIEEGEREPGELRVGDEVEGKDENDIPVLGTIANPYMSHNNRGRWAVDCAGTVHICFADELQLFELEPAPESDRDGFGRPKNPPAAGKSSGFACEDKQQEPTLSPEERAVALPLNQALAKYGHAGHLFLSAATAWYQLAEARNKFKFAFARVVPSHATGTFFDEATAFLRIPDPAKWEGCPSCKGSMRVGDGEKCNSCKGGFTTHVGEGVSADVVDSHASTPV